MFTKYTDLVANVDGMTCGHCKARVEKALEEIKSVKSNVNLEEKKVYIKFSEKKTNIEEIKKAIETAGYPVVDIKVV